MTGILNYGVGNILAFKRIFKRINCPAKIVDKPDDFTDTKKIILPGVGSFDSFIKSLHEKKLFYNKNCYIIIEYKISCPIFGKQNNIGLK